MISKFKYLEDSARYLLPNELAPLIGQLHRVTWYEPVTSGYQKLISSGFEQQLPVDLANQIYTLYVNISTDTNENDAQDLTIYSLNKYRDYLIKYGFPIIDENLGLTQALNLEVLNQIKTDPEFIGILRNYRSSFHTHRQGFTKTKAKLDKLAYGIEEHLTTNSK
jgi:hypothetical protein